MSFSQADQDTFVLKVLDYKTNGLFLEIGSNDPIYINNTYILETKFNWKGIMIECDPSFLVKYEKDRPHSQYCMKDATTIDYKQLLAPYPNNFDYLQIDLEVTNRSTLACLTKLDREIFDTYRFGVVTFEHDIYRGDYFDTRNTSREIFLRRGYRLVFPDVKHDGSPFEDWYIHPELVKKPIQESLIGLNHREIIKLIDSN